ncbi:tyrosine-protein phosphatase Lar [Ixodes scapularis]|uniref:tyrosine-protein phosphatase Lar n=1 Tax=Ixodes scapularis TaxID=6945 RepID=UPI001A9F94C3|nr:tyrosine-protein phosphatase Lar [Ixodes scapularis]
MTSSGVMVVLALVVVFTHGVRVCFVRCPNGSACPDGSTCCPQSSGLYGCCPYPLAVCCSDHRHCCPEGHSCNQSNGTCIQIITSIKEIKTLLTSTVLLPQPSVNSEANASSIVIFPRDQTVVTGQVAVFVCTAAGNPRPQIEWRKNGERISTVRHMVVEMPGGSVLRIDPTRTGRDNATYECLADNGVGEPARALFVLTVIEENEIPPGFPQFQLLPHMQAVERNRSALLPCQAEGDPEPWISWLHNEVPVNMSNPRYSLVSGGSLQISDAQEEDQGNYECIAENSVGTAISPIARLYVRVRRVSPYFTVPPEFSYEVTPGANLNLTCVAVGSPMPYVKWRRGHVDLIPESDVPVGRNNLVLENIKESANYTCVAFSSLGSIEHVSQVLVQGHAQL